MTQRRCDAEVARKTAQAEIAFEALEFALKPAEGVGHFTDSFAAIAAWMMFEPCNRSCARENSPDPAKTRRKRDPGRCFVKAGWERWSVQRGLVVLLAPGERARTNLQGPVMR